MSEEEDLHDPIINAARMGNPTNNTSNKTTYTLTICKACGLTQKKCHQQLKKYMTQMIPQNVAFVDQNLLQINILKKH